MTTRTDAAQPAPAPALGRRPDFFIVGHHKCGTTALYEMLRRHPQIFMPEIKEPWFMAGDERVLLQPSSPLPKTLEQYLALFAPARPEQRAGEATPAYLLSPTAAASIAELQPDARIIAILREPASFLRSLHMQRVQVHAETETDLGRALALEQTRRLGQAIPRDAVRPEDLFYSEHVRYVEQLRRYHAVFPPEQVLVLIYEDFRRDNEATVRQVLRFLDVDDERPLELIEANPTVRVRSQRAYDLLRSLYLGRGPLARFAKPAIKLLTPKRVRREASTAVARRVLYGDPQPPDEALMLELRRRFKPEVLAAGEYLGRDLVSLWGYDRLD
jgi:hypothetical protein